MAKSLHSVAENWKRIDGWLRANAPSDSFTLPNGASDADIVSAERAMGCRLPEDVRESYRIHNGSNQIWLFEQGFLMPLSGGAPEMSELSAVSYWTLMLDVGEAMKDEVGTPNGPIKTDWWNRSWIPLTDNQCGDCICIDLAPEQGGQVGQVIDWWSEQAATAVLANSWSELLANLAARLEAGECRFDTAGSGTIQSLVRS